MPTEYSLTDSYLLGLAYMEAYFNRDDDKTDLIRESSDEDNLETSFLLLNVVLFNEYCEAQNITPQQLVQKLRKQMNDNGKA